jgi:hypothetical protein
MLRLVFKHSKTPLIKRSFASSTTEAPVIGFSMSPEQKELQDLARKFTLQEVIPKVNFFSIITLLLLVYCYLLAINIMKNLFNIYC